MDEQAGSVLTQNVSHHENPAEHLMTVQQAEEKLPRSRRSFVSGVIHCVMCCIASQPAQIPKFRVHTACISRGRRGKWCDRPVILHICFDAGAGNCVRQLKKLDFLPLTRIRRSHWTDYSRKRSQRQSTTTKDYNKIVR